MVRTRCNQVPVELDSKLYTEFAKVFEYKKKTILKGYSESEEVKRKQLMNAIELRPIM